VASGWSANMTSLLKDVGVELPKSLLSTPSNGGVFDFPAFLVVCLVSVILVGGVRLSTNINVIAVIVKVATVLTFLVVAGSFLWRHPKLPLANWTPFIPPNTGKFGEFGWSGVARGAGSIFFAYIGFDAASTAAQEARNPQRDMPIGILGSLGI